MFLVSSVWGTLFESSESSDQSAQELRVHWHCSFFFAEGFDSAAVTVPVRISRTTQTPPHQNVFA